MTSLTAKNIEKLGAFWSSLSPEMRQRVLASANAAAGRDPSQAGVAKLLEKLDALAAPDEGTLQRKRLFAPLDPLTGNPETDPPSRAYFSPGFLSGLWAWFDDAEQSGFSDTFPASGAPTEDWQAIRVRAGEALKAFLESARDDRKLESRIVTMWGAGGRETADLAATLLIHDTVLKDALRDVPDEVTDFDPELCTHVRDVYDDVSERAPDAGVWMLLLLMTRLSKTAQIFRAVEKIGRRSDDQLISKTDLAVVGDAVLKDAEFYATRFRRAPTSIEEANEAVAGLASFVTVTVGMTREFGIRKDGQWGKTLFALRAQASADLEKLMSGTQKALNAALPEPRKGKGGVYVPVPCTEEAIILRAEAQLRFLGGAGEWAAQAAIGSVQKKAEDAAVAALEECCGHLINVLQHSDGETQRLASAGLDVIARLQEALGQVESASLTRRRNAAAMAA